MVKFNPQRTFLLIFLLSAASLWPAISLCEARLTLDIAPQTGSLDDDFMFSVTIDGAASSAYPLLGAGDDFSLRLIGPQSSVSIINGKVTQSVTYKYALTPKKTGILETPSAEVEVDGKKLSADALKVELKAAAADAPAQPKDVFLRQSASKLEAWLGEQIVRNLELYSRVRVLDPKIEDDSYDGFWNESFEGEKRFERVLGGNRYVVTQIRKALWALRPGDLELSARRLSARIPDTRQRQRAGGFGGFDPFDQGLFDDFFGAMKVREIETASNAPVLHIKPLPPLPHGFADWDMGATLVGRTELGVEYSAQPVKVGQSKTREVTVSSTGNLTSLKRVPVQNSTSFRVYEETPVVSHLENNGILLTRKSMRVSLVTLQPGRITIPALSLGYFDPEEGVYKTASSSEVLFEVMPGDNQAPSGADTTRDIMPALSSPVPVTGGGTASMVFKDKTVLERLGAGFSASSVALVLAIVVLMGGVIGVFFRSRKLGLPYRQARERVRQARSAGELSSAFRQALCARYHMPDQAAGASDLRLLMGSKLSLDLALEVNSILDIFDPALYGGAEMFDQELAALRKRCLDVLR